MALRNRAKMLTSTVGAGTLTLTAAEPGFQSFADAGVVDQETVQYVIEDGLAWEVCTGVYTAAGATLTRTLIESSTDALLALTGNAKIYISMHAVDNEFVGSITVGTGKAKFSTPGAANNYNIVIGQNAGTNITTGNANIIIGRDTAVGDPAGITGGSNVAIAGAMNFGALTSGGDNIGIGFQALSRIVSGSRNVAIGRVAGFGLTTASFNTLLGCYAGQMITTGAGNTIVGYNIQGSAALTNTLIMGANGRSDIVHDGVTCTVTGALAATGNITTTAITVSGASNTTSTFNTTAGTNFLRFQVNAVAVGTIAASTVGIYLDADNVQIRALAGGTARLLINSLGATFSGVIKNTPVTVATLPAAATAGAGARSFVTDGSVAASGNFGAVVAGGGTNGVPVYSDGAAWRIG